MPTSDFRGILRTLWRHNVEFLVVGGVAAVLQGAPVSTFDLDVVHSTGEKNIAPLLSALEELQACYRTQPERQLRPSRSHLASPGHQLLMTRFGPLDLLGMIGRGHRYEDLHGDTIEIDIGEGVKVRILNLARLIEVKEETADEKDRASLSLLRRALKENNRS
jgi:hypothetical protein